MTPRLPSVLAPVALAAAAFVAGWLLPSPSGHAQPGGSDKPVSSGRVRVEDAVPTRGDWGEWRRYVRGQTHGAKDLVVLAVTLKPGHAPHPPHQHVEEEFLILADGAGTWHLDGKDHPARKGDVVYAGPWSMHGIKNTSDAPLTYYMFKWSGKGVEPPADRKKRDDKPAPVVGTWTTEDRHLAMGTLYQPIHTVRLRSSIVTFQQDGDRITGVSLTEKGEGLSGDPAWPDGRTAFRTVTFADGRLVFEFDVREVAHGSGRRMKEPGVVRVEAQLDGDRLVGRWRLFLKDGSEPFRGEWEAVRAKAGTEGKPK